MKRIICRARLLVATVMMLASSLSVQAEGSVMPEGVDSLINNLGVNLFEEEIDDIIFQTNEFLTDATFIGDSGPFWWILEMCMALAALFAIIMAAGMAYRMMTKGEPFDVLKLLRVLAIAIVMFWWYPHGGNGASVLGFLAYIPNCIGSYTHDLYEIEAAQVQKKFDALHEPLKQRQDSIDFYKAKAETITKGMQKQGVTDISEYVGYDTLTESEIKAYKF